MSNATKRTNPKILLIEDDALFRTVITKALTEHGYQTTIAEDGEQAFKKISAGSFDLVITDLFMPNKEGLEVIQDIRKTDSVIKIIAISSDAIAGYSSFLKMARAFGADDSLQKPFSPNQLIEKVKLVMSEK